MTDELVEFELHPEYDLSIRIDGLSLDERPLDDPFVSAAVLIGWRDVLKAALRRRPIKVEVNVNGNWDAVRHVMTARPVMVTPPKLHIAPPGGGYQTMDDLTPPVRLETGVAEEPQ